MLAKIKTYGIPIALIIFGLSAFFYGAHVERLEANEGIALMEKEYAICESSALWEAKTIRKQQEAKYLLYEPLPFAQDSNQICRRISCVPIFGLY